MNSSSYAAAGTSSQPDDAATADKAWEAFLAQNKIVPLSLVTINDLNGLERLLEHELVLPNPDRRFRGTLTHKQSDAGNRPSLYDRVSVGGQKIQDNGFQVAKGSLPIKALKIALGLLESGQFVQTNEGSDVIKHKIEVRYRATYAKDAAGLIEMDLLREAIDSLSDDLWFGFYLWVNPTPDGWLRFNLVVSNFDQGKIASLPKIELLEPFVAGDIPTLDVEALGFKF